MTYQKLQNPDTLLCILNEATDKLGISLSDHKKHTLLRYLDNLLLWNNAYNLTAIKSEKEALVKHIIDCLALASTLTNSPKSVLDIGTGAGLPSLILAVVFDDWQVVALDSNSKKIRFIRQMIAELDLPNVTAVASRIEDFEGCFDVITSRAFASLSDFVVLASPYLADDGVMVAMKGKAPNACEFDEAYCYTTQKLDVPFLTDDRCVVSITKKQP